jgi:DNA-binding HxlR family transcriptional regulator
MEDISDIREKLGEIHKLLNKLEKTLSKKGGGIEVNMIHLYRRLIELYYVALQRIEEQERISRLVGGDDIKTWIIRVLARYGEQNISGITEKIRMYRQKISRKTVTIKLKEMEDSGLVEKIVRGNEKIYRLTIKSD